jgi:outer membrane receptor protein involved in Fe transport
VRDVAAWIEEDLSLAPWLRVVAGLRTDLMLFDVNDDTSGDASNLRPVIGPKISLVAQPDPRVAIFVNAGHGFHSNDARAAVHAGADAIATAWGAEVGVRASPVRGVTVDAAAWYLWLSSELVWNGDTGGTTAAGASERLGVDLAVTIRPAHWLSIDADLSLARTDVPLAPRVMGSGGVSWHVGDVSLSLRARGVGPRPAGGDGSLTAEGFFVVDFVGAWTRGPWRIGLTITNLLDSTYREAQVADMSRLRSEPAPVADIHFTPGAPFTALLTLGARFR